MLRVARRSGSDYAWRQNAVVARSVGVWDAQIDALDRDDPVAACFSPVEQASASITRQFGGLGLGLAIAKATGEAHGGTLGVSSPGLGQGATFTVRLPLTTEGQR